MKVLFELNHPAHFYLFINVAKALEAKGHTIAFVIKQKDVLKDLIKPYEEKFIIHNRSDKEKKKGLLNNVLWMLESDFKMYKFCRRFKPDILLGSNFSFNHIGRLMGKPTLICQEDDAEVISALVRISYPFATRLLLPDVCSAGKYNYKKIAIKSYHELSYLHPENFTPDKSKVSSFIDVNQPYFILRFSGLNAYHDKGKKGLGNNLALQIIEILKGHGNIYITSERPLSQEFERYRIAISPSDIHHALYYAQLFIGDSQTMSAESGVLGTPFIRFNDFIGKLGYLKELEEVYQLGFGINSSDEDLLLKKVKELMDMPDIKTEFKARKERFLKEKINYAAFLEWFIEQYPRSLTEIESGSEPWESYVDVSETVY